MVSASHNPAEDNGLKVLDADGLKLDDAVEEELEALLVRADELPLVPPARIGRSVDATALLARYVDHRSSLASSIEAAACASSSTRRTGRRRGWRNASSRRPGRPST